MDLRKIKNLTEGAADTFKGIKQDEEAEKLRTERFRQITDASDFCRQIFWCDRCNQDFETLAVKQCFTWNNELCAKYVAQGKHTKNSEECNRVCIRHITDVSTDPFFRHSKLIRDQQRKYAKDLLQPGDVGFKTLYGDPMKKSNELQENRERADYAIKYGL